jgi:hypothetical protein
MKFFNKPQVLVCTTSQSTFSMLKEAYGKDFKLTLLRGTDALRTALSKKVLPVIFDGSVSSLESCMEYMEEYEEKYSEVQPYQAFCLFLSDKQLEKELKKQEPSGKENILKEIYESDIVSSISNVNNKESYALASEIITVPEEAATFEEILDFFPKAKAEYSSHRTTANVEASDSSISNPSPVTSPTLPEVQETAVNDKISHVSIGEVPNISKLMGSISSQATVPGEVNEVESAPAQDTTPSLPQVPEAPATSVAQEPHLGNEISDDEGKTFQSKSNGIDYQLAFEELQAKHEAFIVEAQATASNWSAAYDQMSADKQKLEQELSVVKQNTIDSQSSVSALTLRKEFEAHEQTMVNIKNAINTQAENEIKDKDILIKSQKETIKGLQRKLEEKEKQADIEAVKRVKLQDELEEYKQLGTRFQEMMSSFPFASPNNRSSQLTQSVNRSVENRNNSKDQVSSNQDSQSHSENKNPHGKASNPSKKVKNKSMQDMIQ